MAQMNRSPLHTRNHCLAILLLIVAGSIQAGDGADEKIPAGFGAFLPAPLSDDWTRSGPVTTAADVKLFGGGISTSAEYTIGDATCVITITGDAPMMQGWSMNFSNPAAAGLTGARVSHVGSESVVITREGEVQTLTGNYLTQYQGNCSQKDKLAYVAIMNFDGLRRYRSAAATTPQPPPPVAEAGSEWDVTFGGVAKDWAYAMTGTADGGLCTAGRTASKGAGLEDAWIVCLDGHGTLLWDRTFGGTAIDRARAVIETRDGALVVAGATESKSAGEFDAWVLKLDANGMLIWERRFGGRATDWASAVVETQDGGLVVAAYTQTTADDPFDFWVFKLTADGELLWERKLGGPKTDWANAITETRDGGLVVVGHTESKGAGDADWWVVKLSADGEPQWERTFGGVARDYASAVTATTDGGIVVAGLTESAGAGGVDSRVIKLDTAGNTVWDRIFGGARDDWVRAVIETRDGGHAVAGYTMSTGAGLFDVWALKLDADGNLLWERTFGGTANDWARALIEMPDGGLAMAGDTWSKGAGQSDVWVIKVAPEQ